MSNPPPLLFQPLLLFGTQEYEVIREGVFRGTYFRDIYSGVNKKCYKNSWKVFDQLKNIYQKYYFSDYYDVSVNKRGVNVEHR